MCYEWKFKICFRCPDQGIQKGISIPKVSNLSHHKCLPDFQIPALSITLLFFIFFFFNPNMCFVF